MLFREDKEKREKGERAEKEFRKWLDKHNIPYLYIQQDNETFSAAFTKCVGAKRPDFMILLPNLGFIFVDVKYRKVNEIHKSFPLDSLETKKYSSLQRKFNLPIWYVISNDDFDYKTWFWIPTSKVFEEGKYTQFTSGKSNMEFFAIPLSNFIQIATDDSLDRLFSKCFMEEIRKIKA